MDPLISKRTLSDDPKSKKKRRKRLRENADFKEVKASGGRCEDCWHNITEHNLTTKQNSQLLLSLKEEAGLRDEMQESYEKQLIDVRQ
jgi:hypothetical protein